MPDTSTLKFEKILKIIRNQIPAEPISYSELGIDDQVNLAELLFNQKDNRVKIIFPGKIPLLALDRLVEHQALYISPSTDLEVFYQDGDGYSYNPRRICYEINTVFDDYEYRLIRHKIIPFSDKCSDDIIGLIINDYFDSLIEQLQFELGLRKLPIILDTNLYYEKYCDMIQAISYNQILYLQKKTAADVLDWSVINNVQPDSIRHKVLPVLYEKYQKYINNNWMIRTAAPGIPNECLYNKLRKYGISLEILNVPLTEDTINRYWGCFDDLNDDDLNKAYESDE